MEAIIFPTNIVRPVAHHIWFLFSLPVASVVIQFRNEKRERVKFRTKVKGLEEMRVYKEKLDF